MPMDMLQNPLRNRHDLGIALGVAVAILLHAAFPSLPWSIRAFIDLFAFLVIGDLLGRRFLPTHSWIASFASGILGLLGVQSFIQTTLYYLNFPLGTASDAISWIVILFLTLCLRPYDRAAPEQNERSHDVERPWSTSRRLIAILNGCIAVASAGIIIHNALNAATIESIRTPWALLPQNTLPAIALLWLSLILAILLVRSSWITALHATLTIGPTLTIIPLLYRIGYGFDGFLHVASEKVLLLTGTLHPKPFYYIGQYVFTTWLTRHTHLSLASIDRWLVPVAAALLIPLSLWILKRTSSRPSPFLVLAMLPIGSFIATTPQSFAYVLGLSALLLSLTAAQKSLHPLLPLTLAAWASATHPLAGIPMFCATMAILCQTIERPKWRMALTTGSVLLAGISIPLLFYVSSLHGNTPIIWNLSSMFQPRPWIERLHTFWPFIGNHFVLWPAWASLVQRALPLTLLLLAVTGIMSRTSSPPERRAPLILTASAVILWIAATVLSTTGDFAFLIDYERGNYADRLNILALLCLLPASLPGLAILWEKVRVSPPIILAGIATTFIASGTALAYSGLPRHDALVTGRGWSTSQSDIDTVKYIDRDAGGRVYTVLANQSVSAAAVAILGFKRYAGDIFFYPIPTGGPLYEHYLHMTYDEPSRDIIRDAARLGKSDLVYVVVNDYWWQAQKVNEAIGSIADQEWVTDNGKSHVYTFDLSKLSNASTTTSGR